MSSWYPYNLSTPRIYANLSRIPAMHRYMTAFSMITLNRQPRLSHSSRKRQQQRILVRVPFTCGHCIVNAYGFTNMTFMPTLRRISSATEAIYLIGHTFQRPQVSRIQMEMRQSGCAIAPRCRASKPYLRKNMSATHDRARSQRRYSVVFGLTFRLTRDATGIRSVAGQVEF